MAGPFSTNGSGLKARAETLAAEGFAELEKLRAEVSALAQAVEGIEHEEARSEAVSKVASGTADGASPLWVSLAPAAGASWRVSAVGVLADTAASRVMGLFLEESLDRPLLNFTTSTTAGGMQGLALSDFWLPSGMRLSVRFPSTTPVGTRCVLHVVARELAVI